MMLQYAVARACSFHMFLVSVFNLITPNLIGEFFMLFIMGETNGNSYDLNAF